MNEMDWGERCLWAGLAFLAAAGIGYFCYAPFHAGVNEFFWNIWEMIAGFILFALFYLAPFALVSSGVGAIWVNACRFTLKEQREPSSRYPAQYQRLVILIPLCSLVAYFAAGWPETTPWVTSAPPVAEAPVLVPAAGKKGKHLAAEQPPIPRVVFKSHYEPRWEGIYRFHEGAVTSLGLSGGTLEKRDDPPYDLGDVSAMVWVCLFLGAPTFAYLKIRGLENAETEKEEAEENHRWEAHARDYETQISGLGDRITELTALLAKKTEENQAFLRVSQFEERKQAEFQGIASSDAPSQGVLETDEI